MIEMTCACGAISVRTGGKPDFLHDCNCGLCRKTGALWGYLDPTDVRVQGSGRAYRRTDKADPGCEIIFCATCGATTHFVLTEATIAKVGNGMMGVNFRLADEDELIGVEVRYPDGRAWSGQGEFGYVRAARMIGEAATE